MTLPKITNDLVRFVAIRLADVTFKEWKEIEKSERARLMDQTREILKAERRFFEKKEAADEQTSEHTEAPLNL